MTPFVLGRILQFEGLVLVLWHMAAGKSAWFVFAGSLMAVVGFLIEELAYTTDEVAPAELAFSSKLSVGPATKWGDPGDPGTHLGDSFDVPPPSADPLPDTRLPNEARPDWITTIEAPSNEAEPPATSFPPI